MRQIFTKKVLNYIFSNISKNDNWTRDFEIFIEFKELYFREINLNYSISIKDNILTIKTIQSRLKPLSALRDIYSYSYSLKTLKRI